ncbi:MAG: Uncharacterized protein G01um101456_462 [Parcubacteria group bacterium Gr01-1014_56]|nr:MAG: Uncharacterized protein G01um101456_462 [Parcubacteria group bacterium Gr01-1014_56]
MKQPLNNIKTEAQHVRLSSSEKDSMRARIYERIGASRRLKEALVRPQPTHWFVFSMRYSMALVAVVVVLVGSTTAYAAQGSLPGGLLYPIKIYVNENVEGALAISNEAKASFHTTVAQERLKEAEALASEGRLDAASAAQIESSFDTHVAQADAIVKTLEDEDAGVAVEVSARLDSSLAAHSSILARIGDGSDDEKTKENSNSFATRVRSRGFDRGEGALVATLAVVAPEVSTMSLSVSEAQDTAVAPTPTAREKASSKRSSFKAKGAATITPEQASTSQKKIALQLQKKATSEFTEATDAFEDAQDTLDASTAAQGKDKLVFLAERLDAGTQQLQDNEYTAARATFTEVLRGSVEFKTFVEASKTYKRDLWHGGWGKPRDTQDDKKGGSEDLDSD